MSVRATRWREFAALLILSGAATLRGQPSFVATPLTEMGLSQDYLGFSGGLYAGGSNSMPADHAAMGAARAAQIQPLDGTGNPSPDGKIVLLSIGMSGATQEFCGHNPSPCNPWSFMGQAAADSSVNHDTLVIVDGAQSGKDAVKWISPDLPTYEFVLNQDLIPAGVTEAQVQAVWLKEADTDPTVSLPSLAADAYTLETYEAEIVRAIRVRYPNVRLLFVSARTYAGYANTTLNPEPYAYESGFAVKWLIQAQIDQMANGGVVVDPRAGDLNYDTVAPWIAWGPYLWTDGLVPRGSDGLVWTLADVEDDGTHPSASGETKVGAMLLRFFQSDARTRTWFLALGDTAMAPTSGPAPGTGIAVTGSGFQPGAALSIGGLPATDVVVTSTSVTATTPDLSPGTLNDVLIANPDSTTGTIPQGFLADFLDVPQTDLFHDDVASIFRAGVTAGCGNGEFCVAAPSTRAEIAVLLLKSRFGPFHAPPPAVEGVFADVHPGDFAADWIEELASLGITGGCGNGDYCPDESVSRAEIAVLLLKTSLGSAYVPPDPTGIFGDVPIGAFADRWIEDLYNRGVTGGCNAEPLLYCPAQPGTRGEIATLLTRTFEPRP